jgi:cyclophilin family peptidyl-prolyl cis-trans isomerase
MESKNPIVLFETTLGDFKVELDAEKAPISTANFLEYVNSNFYTGTIFHRVIRGFMAQGGGFDVAKRQKPVRAPIQNEAANGLKNLRGTLAMARTSDLHSATAQFFVNLVDNGFLDHSGKSPDAYGYAVFGKVIEGMDTIDKMAAAPVAPSPISEAFPQTTIAVRKASVVG